MAAWVIAMLEIIWEILQALWDEGSAAVSTVWDAGSDVAMATLDGAVEWFKDDEVEMSSKVAAVTALGYLLAPDATSSVVTRAVDGIGDTVTGVVDTVDGVVSSLWSTTTGKILIVGGALLLYKLFFGEKETVKYV